MSCTATIRVDEEKPIFSSCDEVRGTVVVQMSKDISVDQIVLKLKGDMKTAVSYTSEKNEKLMSYGDFNFYTRELVLFPSQELRSRTSGKGFTLKAGKHSYKFLMRFPQGHHGEAQFLPPSLTDKKGRFEIRHYLKVVVRRSSMFKSNTRVERSLIYSPCLPESMLADPRRLVMSRAGDFSLKSAKKSGLAGMLFSPKVTGVQMIGDCTYPRAGLAQAPHPMRLSFKIRASEHLILRDLKIQLHEITVWRAYNHTESTWQVRDLIYEQIDKKGTTFELSRLVDNVLCPEYLLPSFSSRLVDRSYKLVATITTANPENLANTQDITMKGDITVLPPQLHNHSSASAVPSVPLVPVAAVGAPSSPPTAGPSTAPAPTSTPQKTGPVDEMAQLYEKPPTSAPPPYSQ